MDIYRAFAENEKDRYIFFYAYPPDEAEVILYLNNIIGYDPYIYDIFPEPNSFSEELEEPLSVLTKIGKEMFIQSGMKITYFDTFRILYGSEDDD